jgi:Xaa-Pro aminopeptidase
MTSSRRSRLQKLLPHALLVSNLTNIRYLTDIQVSSGLLLVTKKSAVLFVDARYAEMASKSAERGLKVTEPSKLSEILAPYNIIGFESEDVTVARLDRWKTQLKNKKFVQTKGLVEGLRRAKEPSELRSIQQACAITKSALAGVTSMLRFGMTERELAYELWRCCMEHGATGMAFETIVGFGENTARPHHHPTNRTLQRGDIVQVDMGANVEGYCSDYSRVYFTAPKTTQQTKAYRALKEAKKAAEKLVKVGALTNALDLEARRVLQRHGYDHDKEFSHCLGHGLGLEIHEGVRLSARGTPSKLLRNEVITIEPGLYFEGKWGMRIEDTIVVR